MKKIFTLMIALMPSLMNAQIPDSVIIGAQYANTAFYSMQNGVVGTMPNNNWDIAIATYSIQIASVKINGAKGVRLWKYTAGDTTAWNNLDTAGIASSTGWTECFDNDTTMLFSAFESGMTGHPNYGWGIYNSVTHDVNGISLFVIKGMDNVYRKIWIKNQKAIGNNMTIRRAHLDNSNDTTVTFSKDYNTKNYIYMSLSAMAVLDQEPVSNTYDLIFDQYTAFINPPGIRYPVAGVRLNRNIFAAQASGIHPNDAVFTNYLFVNNMTVIGHDWKIQPPPVWIIIDSLSYFVEDQSNNIWQMWFTAFSGGGAGKYVFNKRQVGVASIDAVSSSTVLVYPNPAQDQIQIRYTANRDAQMSLLDLTGKTIMSRILPSTQGIENNFSLDLYSHQISSGIYILQLELDGKMNTQKLIIQ